MGAAEGSDRTGRGAGSRRTTRSAGRDRPLGNDHHKTGHDQILVHGQVGKAACSSIQNRHLLFAEIYRVEWFPIDKAISNASYPQEKTVLRKARELIST